MSSKRVRITMLKNRESTRQSIGQGKLILLCMYSLILVACADSISDTNSSSILSIDADMQVDSSDLSLSSEDAFVASSHDQFIDDMANRPCMEGESRACPAVSPCEGATQVCINQTWSTCQYEKDVCDGIDQDCDGSLDEEFLSEEITCGLGSCQAIGQTTCPRGTVIESCIPTMPQTEQCDQLDNDCDGVIDEELDMQRWYPDFDADGNGVRLTMNCMTLLEAGYQQDGVYTINLTPKDGEIEGEELDIFCDMTTDGGGWTRIFFHDIIGGYFESNEDAHARNRSDPLAPRYSILDQLESFRSQDGTFDFRINWPDSGIEGRNIWRQTSNPTTVGVQGYKALDIDFTDYLWGGLELSSQAATYLDGSVNSDLWFYSIGSQIPWNNPPGIPAYAVQSPRVALWVRPRIKTSDFTPVYACAQPVGYAATHDDCNDLDASINPYVSEVCNDMDDNCDGIIDPIECPFGDLILTSSPQPLHFYPRSLEDNQCQFTIEGEILEAATEVRIRVYRDHEIISERIEEEIEDFFTIPVTLESGLYLYDVEIAWGDGTGGWRVHTHTTDIVCGDVFVINGQSNAVALDYHQEGLGDQYVSTFIRSYGSAVVRASVVNHQDFVVAVADLGLGIGSIGQWGMRLAHIIKETQQVPVLVMNGAVGGTSITQHQRNPNNPENPETIYGRLLWRTRQAKVADHVRAIFWHQGESDLSRPYAEYLSLWSSMYQAWLEDFPHVQGIFPFQVRAGCGNPTWNRNVQRELPTLFPKVLANMSTTGVDGHDACHFFHAAYSEWGERMARIVRREIYQDTPSGAIDAPNPEFAFWRSPTELVIEFGATGEGLIAQEGVHVYFSVSDGVTIESVEVEETRLLVTTTEVSIATWVSFVDVAGDIPWLINDLGIGSFVFYQFPIMQ